MSKAKELKNVGFLKWEAIICSMSGNVFLTSILTEAERIRLKVEI